MPKIGRDDVPVLAERFEKRSSEEVLRWSLDKFHSRIALASNFGAEDVALIDMLCKIHSKPRIFTIDTGRLHQETYTLMDVIRERYGIKIDVYFPQTKNVQDMGQKYGLNPFYKNSELRRLCCEIRKVEPLVRMLSGLDAWITGLRREQSPSRANIKKIEVDTLNRGIIKVNPIADWTIDQVWKYIRDNNIPYNKLYDEGYTSIGCAPCTRPIKPGEDPRAGRWWWEQDAIKECGLHTRLSGKFVLKHSE